MSQVKTQRISLQPRSPSSSSIASLPRPRRININLPSPSVTSAAFLSPLTGESTLSEDLVNQERARYTTLVSKSATSEVSHRFLYILNAATFFRCKNEFDKLTCQYWAGLFFLFSRQQALMKMPNVATKPDSSDDMDLLSYDHSSADPIACNLPRTNPTPHSNTTLTIEAQQLASFASGYPIQVSPASCQYSFFVLFCRRVMGVLWLQQV
ncbi:MAG: hypothetical protein J3R72DRAFT_121060 [Linnemannia gamsii]|nr:MAG: hypothetical protein J3R72DRAFT_121060 [Linnemannia gamsii]